MTSGPLAEDSRQPGHVGQMRGGKFISFCIAAGCLMTATPALACTCAAPATAEQALQQSSAVFSGKVIEIYRPFLDRIGITRSHTHRVRFEITKPWKGVKSKEFVVTTRLSGEACGYPFERGKEYLVYVVDTSGDIETGICTGTREIAGAESEMKELDVLLQSTSDRLP